MLYLDCGMGVAGDMLAGALLGLLDEKDAFIKKVNNIGLPHIEISYKDDRKCGVVGTHVTVLAHGVEEGHEHGEHHHHHEHYSLKDVERVIDHLDVSTAVKTHAYAVYKLIAEAESEVHGEPVNNIHFHEVGSLDAIADVVTNCMLMEELGYPQVMASSIRTGFGTVKCAHGILPVPAPATALLLQGIPVYAGDIQGEMCTPTGAALIKHFASGFGTMPETIISKTGYGTGNKDFGTLNAVRAVLSDEKTKDDRILILSCNIDDMTGEEIAFAQGQLLAAGAKDVYIVPIYMKKNRPAQELNVICNPSDEDVMADLILRYTETLGVRVIECRRHTLPRTEETLNTVHGTIRSKTSSAGSISRTKIEYEDAARIAREKKISLRQARKLIESELFD